MEEEVHGMYTKLITTLYRRIAIAFAILFNCVNSSANTTVVLFDFEDSGGVFENRADVLNVGLTTSPWFDQRDSLTDFSGQPNTGRALAARSFVTGNSLQVELTVEPGFALLLDGYQFDHFASANGPQSWDLFVDGVSIGRGATQTTFTQAEGAVAVGDLRGTILVALVGANAATNAGTYRIDNFQLSGNVSAVPLAPSLVLLSSGLGLLRVRRQ